MMKSVVVSRYGGPEVLELVDRPIPEPGTGEVRIKTVAASLNAADWHIMRGDPSFLRLSFGWRRPKIAAIGADVAGHVDAVGEGVPEFALGDAVYGDLSGVGFGGCSEYVIAPARLLAPIPPGIPVESAAAIPLAGVTALQGLRDLGEIQAGHRVAVNGASGGVGTFAVQIAKALGAEVTAICGPAKLAAVTELSGGRVIDYSKEDVTQGDQSFDIVLDAGAFRSIFDYSRVLSPRGKYVFVGGANQRIFQAMTIGSLRSRSEGVRYSVLMAKASREDLETVGRMVADRTVRPIIGARFPLKDVPLAMAALETRTYPGKIVIDL